MNSVLNINNKIVNKIGLRADLLLHFEVSALICLILCMLLPAWLAAVITLILGIIKEVIDVYRQSGFDWLDLLADILGILLIV